MAFLQRSQVQSTYPLLHQASGLQEVAQKTKKGKRWKRVKGSEAEHKGAFVCNEDSRTCPNAPAAFFGNHHSNSERSPVKIAKVTEQQPRTNGDEEQMKNKSRNAIVGGSLQRTSPAAVATSPRRTPQIS
ncbi:uncharacterized protein G2W53_000938 [Senna tora]|uniref:Uncharacterized protein n=1 Tax=Senna tora TaxID=362788 RepID=A0A834XIS4_9FABA|nr:uncharacterized protein G2W53_000938 [Senna tora]